MKNKGSILVIEDDIEIQEIFKMLLEQEGFSVTAVATCAEALQFMRSDTRYSLILLDNILPDMRALEFLDKLDHDHLGAEVPVILCSGTAELKEIKMPAQVVALLPKPFQIEDFFSAVRKFAS